MAASWPSSTKALGNSWHGHWFHMVRCVLIGGMIFTVSANLCERITSGKYIIIKVIYILDVTFFADLNLPRIVRNLISHPLQVL